MMASLISSPSHEQDCFDMVYIWSTAGAEGRMTSFVLPNPSNRWCMHYWMAIDEIDFSINSRYRTAVSLFSSFSLYLYLSLMTGVLKTYPYNLSKPMVGSCWQEHPIMSDSKLSPGWKVPKGPTSRLTPSFTRASYKGHQQYPLETIMEEKEDW